MRLFDIEDYISKCGEDLIFAKCLDIKSTGEGLFKLKLQTSENEVFEIGGDALANKMSQGKIKVINVTHSIPTNRTGYVWWYKWDSDEILDYCLLESSAYSEESEKAALKSNITGTNTYIEGSEEMHIENYTDIVVTDKANVLNKKVRVKTAMFIGNKTLKQTEFEAVASIMCRNAIIKNRCVFGSLIRRADVPIRSKRIYLCHEFIDLNTVNEVLAYFAYSLENLHESYAQTLIYVDFAKCKISEGAAANRALSIIKDRVYKNNKQIVKMLRSSNKIMWDSLPIYESILPYISLACSMYISTGYKYDDLLEMAEICLEETFSEEEDYEENMDELTLLKHLIVQLHSGMRF